MVLSRSKRKNKYNKTKAQKIALIKAIFYFSKMKKQVFKFLAKTNKILLPSMGKQEVDMSKAKKWQMALIGWRYYVTKNSLD